jgi:YidC/Oxa1 family membrane protein insertase
VVVLAQVIFPGMYGPKAPAGRGDSTAVAARAGTPPGAAATAPTSPGKPLGTPPGVVAAPAAGTPADSVPRPVAVAAETVSVGGTRASYQVSTLGGALLDGEMRTYRSLVPGVGGAVRLARPNEPLLQYRLVIPGDTIALARTPFRLTRAGTGAAETLRLDGSATTRAGATVPVTLTYAFAPDSFTVRVGAAVQGVTGPAFLLVDLPSGLRQTEPDSLDHFTNLSYAYNTRGGAEGVRFSDLDPGERELAEGPISWAAAKSKYFIVGVLAPRGAPGFREISVTGGVRTEKVATRAQATLVADLTSGATFDVYAGPQEWRRLVALGRDFENSNPYGGWLQGLVQPFATFVIRILLWMRETLQVSYGWVLVIFGILVRLVLWPLNQNAMRSQIKMQRLQPELQAVQERHRDDPARFQQEMMKVYKAHGMSPLSPLTGCLPLLIPMPVFFALFFVFQNTIEFRGVPFLWMLDLSRHDPYYVLPVLVALTTFVLSWIGMRNAPPNPQAKVMAYAMPAMFMFFFLRMASGLNLYYLMQNLTAIPQQWLLTKERTRSQAQPMVQGTPTTPTRAGGKTKTG